MDKIEYINKLNDNLNYFKNNFLNSYSSEMNYKGIEINISGSFLNTLNIRDIYNVFEKSNLNNEKKIFFCDLYFRLLINFGAKSSLLKNFDYIKNKENGGYLTNRNIKDIVLTNLEKNLKFFESFYQEGLFISKEAENSYYKSYEKILLANNYYYKIRDDKILLFVFDRLKYLNEKIKVLNDLNFDEKNQVKIIENFVNKINITTANETTNPTKNNYKNTLDYYFSIEIEKIKELNELINSLDNDHNNEVKPKKIKI